MADLHGAYWRVQPAIVRVLDREENWFPVIGAGIKKLMLLTAFDEIVLVLDEALVFYWGYEAIRLPIELVNYHEKCAV